MKERKVIYTLTSSFIILLLLGAWACKKESFENEKTLKKLYRSYKFGEISECTYLGETVYLASIIAYDASEYIYDKEGKLLGTCSTAWGNPDTICKQVRGCETIYRAKDNSFGLPAVDKYGLGR